MSTVTERLLPAAVGARASGQVGVLVSLRCRPRHDHSDPPVPEPGHLAGCLAEVLPEELTDDYRSIPRQVDGVLQPPR
ncbi:hypothetical protein SAMN05660209_03613 [Geodermatophilus africanus]|uniref:Uncharacterized protein n=1 Tax=Geodermatophilus africanus TaxID=1137993 RepID=A0A1H3MGQ6_9ACTN|nr:hypothetical protein [Geodermatophilus africanus]SDY75524.1 hypothetical protein SAMN05660209_03613 [Geodermatophilus africanus]